MTNLLRAAAPLILVACGGSNHKEHEAPVGKTGVAVTLPKQMELDPDGDVRFVPLAEADVHRNAGTTIELEESEMPTDADLDFRIRTEAAHALEIKDITHVLRRGKQGDVLTLTGHVTDKRGSIDLLETWLPTAGDQAVHCKVYAKTVDKAAWDVCLSLHKIK